MAIYIVGGTFNQLFLLVGINFLGHFFYKKIEIGCRGLNVTLTKELGYTLASFCDLAFRDLIQLSLFGSYLVLTIAISSMGAPSTLFIMLVAVMLVI